MIGVAKKESSLLPGLAALRLVLLLVVAFCLPETRVWGFAVTPQPASGVFESASPSSVGEFTTVIGYDASGSPVAARGAVGHHTIPRAIQKRLPTSVREHPDVRGRAGNPNIKQIPESTLKQIHSSPPGDYYPGGNYNRRFNELIRQNGGYNAMTPEQINQIRDQVVREFGL